MVRTLLYLAIVVAQFAAGLAAFGRSPDEVTGSPIPSLHAPAPKSVSQSPQGQKVFLANPLMPNAVLGINSRSALSTTVIPQRDDASKTNTDAAARAEIWNSAEMLKAREDVADFSRRSAQTSPGEGEKFLARLEALSSQDMRNWLARYQSRRTNISQQRDTEQFARQLMLERAINTQEAARQAYYRASDLRREATVAAHEQQLAEQLYAEQIRQARKFGPLRDNTLTSGMIWILDPLDAIDAVCDPSSPRGYGRRVAGAMSLPGDLRPDDPRNFIREEEGVDFGDGVTSRDAQPPVVEVDAEPADPIFVGPVAE